jgi:hypothetical protein
MELLATIVVAIWLVGIPALVASVRMWWKLDTSAHADLLRDTARANPVVFGIVLSVLISFWPGTLIYIAATEGFKK